MSNLRQISFRIRSRRKNINIAKSDIVNFELIFDLEMNSLINSSNASVFAIYAAQGIS
jgi:hypothetical protein